MNRISIKHGHSLPGHTNVNRLGILGECWTSNSFFLSLSTYFASFPGIKVTWCYTREGKLSDPCLNYVYKRRVATHCESQFNGTKASFMHCCSGFFSLQVLYILRIGIWQILISSIVNLGLSFTDYYGYCCFVFVESWKIKSCPWNQGGLS